MRRRPVSMLAAILLALGTASSAVAAPPAKFSEPVLFIFPDFELGLVLFVNIDRETFCTPEIAGWEEDLLDWIEGGEVGPPPEYPGDPEGFGLVSFQGKETGKGAIVERIAARGLYAEVWEMDADAPGIGACTDTDGAMHRLGTGTAALMSHDNDVLGSGTRGNSFGNRGVINFVGEDGDRHRYSWRFHTNSRCNADPGDVPACEVDSSTLR